MTGILTAIFAAKFGPLSKVSANDILYQCLLVFLLINI